jgi:hypothetical protein
LLAEHAAARHHLANLERELELGDNKKIGVTPRKKYELELGGT